MVPRGGSPNHTADVRQNMETPRINLPLLVFVPANWKLDESAEIYSTDMELIGNILHGRSVLTKVFNLPVYTVETATLILVPQMKSLYTITLSPDLILEMRDSEDNITGCIKPKTFSVLPEYEYVLFDHDGNQMGSIRPGIWKSTIIADNHKIQTMHSKDRSKGLKPKMNVWEYKSDEVENIDARLLLGHASMSLLPDISVG